MGPIAYGKSLAGYIGAIMAVSQLALIVLTIGALTLLNVQRDKVNRTLFYVFKSILWFILVIGLLYALWGLITGIQYRLM